MNRIIRWYDYLTVNVFWLGITALSQTMTPLIVPLLVQQFVGEAVKGASYGNLRLWTLMVALLAQAFWGMLSDHSRSSWGRRRPFIFGGTVALIICVVLVGLTANLEGMTGYWTLFGILVLMMIASNSAHAAEQGLIPDLIPLERRGLFSSIKAIFEIPLPVIITAFVIGKMVAAGNMWGAIFAVIIILVVTMGITMFVPEQKQENVPSLNWKPFIQLILMTVIFTVIILGMGELSKLANRWLGASLTGNPWLIIVGSGLIGLVAMLVAVTLGVITSVRASLGSEGSAYPNFKWWIVNRLAFLVGANNLASFTVYFLQGRLGYVQSVAAGPGSKLTMFVGIFILVAALPSGWLTDKFGRKPMVIAAGLLAALGTAIALSIPSLTVIYIGGCFIGAGMGLFYTANWALGTEIVPREQAGRYLGISNLAGAGAGAIGAYIGGPIADFITAQVPSIPGIGYVTLFVIYGLLFLLSIIPLFMIKLPKAT